MKPDMLLDGSKHIAQIYAEPSLDTALICKHPHLRLLTATQKLAHIDNYKRVYDYTHNEIKTVRF